MISVLEAALAVNADGLVQSCMELVEQKAHEVVAEPSFATTVTEESLTRITENPRLAIDEERLYDAVVAWGQATLASAPDERTLAEVVAKPMSGIRLGLIPPIQLTRRVMPARLVSTEALILALGFHAGGPDAVPDPSSPQYSSRTGSQQMTGYIMEQPTHGHIAVSESGTLATGVGGCAWHGACLGLSAGGIAAAGMSHGEHYAEFELVAASNKFWMVGVCDRAAMDLSQTNCYNQTQGRKDIVACFCGGDGKFYHSNLENRAIPGCAGNSFNVIGAKVGLLINANTRLLEIYKNGALLGSTTVEVATPFHWCVSINQPGSATRLCTGDQPPRQLQR